MKVVQRQDHRAGRSIVAGRSDRNHPPAVQFGLDHGIVPHIHRCGERERCVECELELNVFVPARQRRVEPLHTQ